jgi:hypothetical protein
MMAHSGPSSRSTYPGYELTWRFGIPSFTTFTTCIYMSTGNLDPSEPCSLRKADRSCEEIYWGDWLHCDRVENRSFTLSSSCYVASYCTKRFAGDPDQPLQAPGMGFRTSRLVRILDMSTGNLDPSEPCSLRKADRSCEEIYWGDWLHCDRGLEWLSKPRSQCNQSPQ